MPIRVDRTEEIRKALAAVYLKLFTEIKKDRNYPIDITFLKSKYNRKVYDASRKAVSEVFAESHKYVGRRLKVETFISDRDLGLIKEGTDKAVSLFWTRLDADAGREQKIAQQQNRLIVQEVSNPFDTEFYLDNAAMITTTGALAIGTLSKTDQIASDPELNATLDSRPVIRWVTKEDEKVCLQLPNGLPGCAFLDGQTWDYIDPDIPVPGRLGPNGTHPNCRCYLSLE